MIISIIVAIATNGCIGKQNEIPWYLPQDLAYFKQKTIPHHVIMGRKCYESIPEKFRPLPNRTNIVITRQKNYKAKGAIVVNSLEEALTMAQFNNETEAFVIGGGEIYTLAMNIAHKLYVTQVATQIEAGDTFFPKIDKKIWQLTSATPHKGSPENNLDYVFEVYEKY